MYNYLNINTVLQYLIYNYFNNKVKKTYIIGTAASLSMISHMYIVYSKMQQILPEFAVEKKIPNQKEGWYIEDPREQLNKHFVSINSHYGFIGYMQEVSARSTLFIRI